MSSKKKKKRKPGKDGLYRFSIRTDQPIAACLHKIESYPTPGASGPPSVRSLYSIRLENLSEETGSFRMSVFTPGMPNFWGATATVNMESVGDMTLLQGQIRNLNWRYFWFAQCTFWTPVIIGGILVKGEIFGIVIGLFLLSFLYGAYFQRTSLHCQMLYDSIRERLDIRD